MPFATDGQSQSHWEPDNWTTQRMDRKPTGPRFNWTARQMDHKKNGQTD